MANEALIQHDESNLECGEKFADVCKHFKEVCKFFLDFVRLATLALSVVAIVLAVR